MSPSGAPLPRLETAEWLRRPQTQAVFKAIEAGGFAARAVGGAVRNALLGLPVADVDIATSAPPKEVVRLVELAGLKAIGTGLKHGTVTVISGHAPYEVTTLREDVQTFGRHAHVAFTADWSADARRRDFTINALYCEADGTIHDPLGGYPDIPARRVRFIGDASARIEEDYLRILRFFRMSAIYAAGPLDAEGLLACTQRRIGLERLSRERVRQELLRLLAAPRAVEVVETMQDYGLLTAVLPMAPRTPIMRRLAEIEATLAEPADPILRLAALAVEIVEDAEKLLHRLRLSTAEYQTLAAAAQSPPAVHAGMDERAAKEWIYRLGPDRVRNRVLLDWARRSIPAQNAAARSLYTLPERWSAPRLPLGGADIMAAGVPAGPHVGQILRDIEEWWIAAGFPDGRKAIEAELMRRLASTAQS